MPTFAEERCSSPKCPRYGWKSQSGGPSVVVPWDQVEESESPAAPWTEQLRDAAERLALSLGDVLAQSGRIEKLEGELAEIKGQMLQMQQARCCVVPITTFEPDPFDVIKEIPAVVVPSDDGYLATFYDANIGMTGDTREEAIANLRLLLADMFEDFEAQASQLGPEPERQLAVLRTFMRRRPGSAA